jgi:hypothetical protein
MWPIEGFGAGVVGENKMLITLKTDLYECPPKEFGLDFVRSWKSLKKCN